MSGQSSTCPTAGLSASTHACICSLLSRFAAPLWGLEDAGRAGLGGAVAVDRDQESGRALVRGVVHVRCALSRARSRCEVDAAGLMLGRIGSQRSGRVARRIGFDPSAAAVRTDSSANVLLALPLLVPLLVPLLRSLAPPPPPSSPLSAPSSSIRESCIRSSAATRASVCLRVPVCLLYVCACVHNAAAQNAGLVAASPLQRLIAASLP